MRRAKILQTLTALALAVLGGTAVGVGLWSAPAALAEEVQSNTSTMIVEPMYQTIILTPGETWSGSLQVRNPNLATQNLKFSVSVGSFSQKATADSHGGDNGIVDIDEVTEYNEMMKWIDLGLTEGEVEPNGVTYVPFTITVPENVAGGGQYASIIITNDTPINDNEGGMDIQSTPQIASVLYAEIAGESRKEGEITNNAIPGFLLSGDLTVEAMVQNTGNVHDWATFTLQVWPMGSSEEICTNEEDPERSLVMPESTSYNSQKCELGPVGIYKAKQTIAFAGKTSEIEKTVIVCPVWLIIVIVAVLALIVFIIVKHCRRKTKQA